VTTSIEELRLRLQEIAEELADLAHETLRAAVRAGGSPEEVAQERRLARARRSVLKAVSVLSGPDGGDD
jgi:hypothetical protein